RARCRHNGQWSVARPSERHHPPRPQAEQYLTTGTPSLAGFLVSQFHGSQLAQLIADQGQELLGRLAITVFDGGQNPGDFFGRKPEDTFRTVDLQEHDDGVGAAWSVARRSFQQRRLLLEGADIDDWTAVAIAISGAVDAALVCGRCVGIVPFVNCRAAPQQCMSERAAAVVLERTELRVERVGGRAQLISASAEADTARVGADEVVAQAVE